MHLSHPPLRSHDLTHLSHPPLRPDLSHPPLRSHAPSRSSLPREASSAPPQHNRKIPRPLFVNQSRSATRHVRGQLRGFKLGSVSSIVTCTFSHAHVPSWAARPQPLSISASASSSRHNFLSPSPRSLSPRSTWVHPSLPQELKGAVHESVDVHSSIR
eukprot:810415-Rhodomonas_salina.1